MLRLLFIAACSCLIPPGALANTGLIPLTDLGSGLYLGQYQGGLYPGGSNLMPATHAAAGNARALSIIPRDTLGNTSASGKFVLISVGMSNTTQEWCSGNSDLPADPWTFMGQAAVSGNVNHTTLAIVNGAQGGKA